MGSPLIDGSQLTVEGSFFVSYRLSEAVTTETPPNLCLISYHPSSPMASRGTYSLPRVQALFFLSLPTTSSSFIRTGSFLSLDDQKAAELLSFPFESVWYSHAVDQHSIHESRLPPRDEYVRGPNNGGFS